MAKPVYRTHLKMKTLPPPEWHLYKKLEEKLGLEDMREVFIIGLLCMYEYSLYADGQRVLRNVIAAWRDSEPIAERRYEI